MPAKRSAYNRSGPLTRLRNERPATAAFSQRRRPGPECASPQTRSRCAGFLRVRGDEIVRTLVNVSVGVVEYVKPSFSLLFERTFCDHPPHPFPNESTHQIEAPQNNLPFHPGFFHELEFLGNHQQESDMTEIAYEAASHYIACLQQSRCASRGPACTKCNTTIYRSIPIYDIS